MLFIGKVNDKAPNHWEALIRVVLISTYESIVIGIGLKLNDVFINILKIHFSFSDFAQNNVNVE